MACGELDARKLPWFSRVKVATIAIIGSAAVAAGMTIVLIIMEGSYKKD